MADLPAPLANDRLWPPGASAGGMTDELALGVGRGFGDLLARVAQFNLGVRRGAPGDHRFARWAPRSRHRTPAWAPPGASPTLGAAAGAAGGSALATGGAGRGAGAFVRAAESPADGGGSDARSATTAGLGFGHRKLGCAQ